MKEILLFLKSNPYWISGFTCGEGCFTAFISLASKPLQSTWGIIIQLEFTITQS